MWKVNLFAKNISCDNPYRFIISETSSRIEKIYIFLLSSQLDYLYTTFCFLSFFKRSSYEQQKSFFFVLKWIYIWTIYPRIYTEEKKSIRNTHMFALYVFTHITHTIRVYNERVQGGEETKIILSSKYKYLGCII